MTTRFQGAAQAFRDSLIGLGLLLAVSILVIYVVLGVLYESFAHPVTILTALPFAGFGALVTLWIFRSELSVYAFVGIIMLMGLVKKNGIMMVDFALVAQRSGQERPRRHPRGLHHPLPPHHDDHHGGALRHPAAGHRHRRRAPRGAGRWAWRWWAA